jgi:hypothetical protein
MDGERDGPYGGVRWQRRGEAWRGCQCARDGCMALQSERNEARPRRVEKKGRVWLGGDPCVSTATARLVPTPPTTGSSTHCLILS